MQNRKTKNLRSLNGKLWRYSRAIPLRFEMSHISDTILSLSLHITRKQLCALNGTLLRTHSSGKGPTLNSLQAQRVNKTTKVFQSIDELLPALCANNKLSHKANLSNQHNQQQQRQQQSPSLMNAKYGSFKL